MREANCLDVIDHKWKEHFDKNGFNVIDGAMPNDLCGEIHDDLSSHLSQEAERWQDKYKDGVLPFPFLNRPSLIPEVITPNIVGIADRILNEESLLYLMMASIVSPNRTHYASRFHRDISFDFPRKTIVLGLILCLTDFHEDNGATIFCEGSHEIDDWHRKDFNVKQVTAKAGSIIVFDGRTLHKSGENITNSPRSCLAMGFCNSFVRQKFDFLNLIDQPQLDSFSLYQKHKLGASNIVPKKMDEFLRGNRPITT